MRRRCLPLASSVLSVLSACATPARRHELAVPDVRQSTTYTCSASALQAVLAYYGIEAEFADAIRRQWLFTMLAGVLLIAGFGVSLNLLLSRKQGA